MKQIDDNTIEFSDFNCTIQELKFEIRTESVKFTNGFQLHHTGIKILEKAKTLNYE